jgi:hypothetical protein
VIPKASVAVSRDVRRRLPLVERRRHRGEALQMADAPSQLAFVDRREGGRHEGDGPQGPQSPDRIRKQSFAIRGRRRPLDDPRALRVRRDHVQERVPRSDLEAGPVRAEQGDRDDVDEHEDRQRARETAHHLQHPGDVETVEEPGAGEDRERALAFEPAHEQEREDQHAVEDRGDD